MKSFLTRTAPHICRQVAAEETSVTCTYAAQDALGPGANTSLFGQYSCLGLTALSHGRDGIAVREEMPGRITSDPGARAVGVGPAACRSAPVSGLFFFSLLFPLLPLSSSHIQIDAVQ